MNSVKNRIYDLIQNETFVNKNAGLTTKEVSEKLAIQRTNASAVLNELVKEGLLKKNTGRPVVYTMANDKQPRSIDDSCFNKIIGYNGSLRNAVSLAKAAILYPKKSLNILISSHVGCGTTYFTKLIHEFGMENGVFKVGAPYIKVNCRHYIKNIELLSEVLFGSVEIEGAFSKAKEGILFIDHFDLLSAKQQSIVFGFLDNYMITLEDKVEVDYSDVMLILSTATQQITDIQLRVPVVIELLALNKRPLSEKFELLKQAFVLEASYADKTIEVTRESLQALLLYDFEHNLKQLTITIKSACAKAYLRVVGNSEESVLVCLDDFSDDVASSLVALKYSQAVVDELIGKSKSYFFAKQDGSSGHTDVYVEISNQYTNLLNKGIDSEKITDVVGNHIQNIFKGYVERYKASTITNLEQLSLIVDQRIIKIIDEWKSDAEQQLNRNIPSSAFYGMCLHINSLLNKKVLKERLKNEQVIKIIENNPQEYATIMYLSKLLKAKLDLDLPVEEQVLLTMFLVNSETDSNNKPVLLYIMHGSGVAKALKDVTCDLTQTHNTYNYDMNLNIDTKTAISELRALIIKINQGAGIIAIYDMGSIKTMLDTIQEETAIKIRHISVPVTLLGIEFARKCQIENDIDKVYHNVILEARNMFFPERKRKLIVTLCHSGEGGAVQLKQYLDKYSLLDYRTIALAITDKSELLREIINLRNTYDIHAFVGTYDPALLGIPFISIAKVFETSKENLDKLLMFEPIDVGNLNYQEIYDYLEEVFVYTSISKVKSLLPDVIGEIALLFKLNLDQKVGLFMHIACLIERLLEGTIHIKNPNKDKVIDVFEQEYKILAKLLMPLEKSFKVIFDDNELATIIMIIKGM
ncbi:MAG: PRD domain-containing protein [Erysipelotrichaceae bacterium]